MMLFLAVLSICLGLLAIFMNWKFKLSNAYVDHFTKSYSEDIFKGSVFYNFRRTISKDGFKRRIGAEAYAAGLSLVVIGVLILILGYWSIINTVLLVGVGLVILHVVLSMLAILFGGPR